MYNLKKAKINQNFPITIINAKEQKAFIGVDGKSEQETRSGKNLYNIFDINNVSGLTVNNDGWATATINNSSGASLIILNLKVPTTNLINVSTNYALFLEIETVSGQGFLCLNEPSVKSQFQTDRTLSLSTLTANSVNKYIMTTRNNFESSTNMFWSYLYSEAGKSCSIKYRLSVLADTSITTDDFVYEPYGASPSPDYPSEIHSVADDVNLLNLENIENHSVNFYYENIGTNFQLKAGETYTLSFDAESDITPFNVGIGCGSSGNYQSDILNKGGFQNGRISITFTPQNSNFTYGNYLALRFVRYNNSTSYKYSAKNIKLQKGTTSTPYSPYNQGTVTIKQRGKNENDGINYGFYIGAEATTYRISGADNGLCIPIENEVYTISSKEIQNRYRIACSNSLPSNTSQNCFNGVVKDGTNDNVTIDTSGYKYLLINCTNINDIQIEQGSTSTPYEPYQANDYTIQTEPLRSLPNGVKDTIEADGIHRRVGRQILSNVEFLTSTTLFGVEGKFGSYELIGAKNEGRTYTFMSDKIMYANEEFLQYGAFRNSTNLLVMTSSDDTVENFNSKISGAEILYELAEEIIEPFTEEQQEVINSMKTFEGTNIFDLQQDIDTSATIEYREKITEEIKNAVINNAEKAYIEVLDTGEIFDETENLKSVKLNDERYIEGRGFIGSVIAKELTGSFINDNDFFKNIENKEIKYYNGPVMGDDSVKYFDYGTFIVQKPENDNVKDDTSFVAFDYMIKFNKKFENRLDYSTGTVTVLQLLENICDQVDVKLGTKTFRNSDFIIENNQFVGGETCRDVLSQIAQIAFSWARIDENDELVLDFNPTEIISETLNPDDYFDLELNEVFGPVNTIAFSNSKVTGEYVSIHSDDYSPQEDEQIAIEIQDNYFAYTENKRRQLLEAARPLLGLTYTPLKVKTCGRNYLNCSDKIEISNLQDIPCQTYIFNNKLDFNGTTFDEKSSPSITKVQQEFSFTGEYKGAIRKTEIIVDKANGTITDYIQKVDGAVTELAEIKRDINGLSVSLGKSGGNNLLYYDTEFWRLTIYDILYRGFENFSSITETSINTLLDTTITEYNEEEERISFVYENHNIEINQIKNPPIGEKDFSIRTNPFLEKIKSSNSIQETESIYTFDDVRKNTLSGLGYYLKQEKVEQEVIVPNGDYTLSFLYKTLDPGATSKVFIDNGETEQEYTLTSNTDNFKDFQLSREAIDEDISLIEETINNAPSFDDITSQYLEDNLGIIISDYSKTDSEITFSAFDVDYTITQKISLKNSEGSYVTQLNEILETVDDFDIITENFLNTNLGVTITDYEKQNYIISFNIEEENYIILLELEIHSISTKYNYLSAKVLTNTLKIKFETNLDRSVMIADIMLNSGTDKLDWTQNANETLTDTVTIGKGIVIESETDDVKFKADTDGIRIVKKDDEEDESARFTNLGTETKNIEVKNTSNLGGLIVRKISNKKIWILLGND